MQFFPAAGEDKVLFAELNEFITIAHAVSAGGAGGTDRVVHAVDFERGCQTGGGGTRHGSRHHVGTDAPYALFPEQINGQTDVFGGCAP